MTRKRWAGLPGKLELGEHACRFAEAAVVDCCRKRANRHTVTFVSVRYRVPCTVFASYREF